MGLRITRVNQAAYGDATLNDDIADLPMFNLPLQTLQQEIRE